MDVPNLKSPSMTTAASLLEPFPGAPALHAHASDVRPIVALSPSVARTLQMLGLADHLAGGPASAAALGPPQPVLSLLAGEPAGLPRPRPRFAAPGHRRTNSASKDLTVPGPWRSAARRIAFAAGDWAPLHELHAERIAALGSPLVLTWEPERSYAKDEGGVLPVAEAAHAPVLDALRRMDAPADVVTLPPPRSVSDVFAAVACVGAIVGVAAAAEALVERLRGDLRAIATRCFARPPPAARRVLVLRSVAPYIVAGGWMPELARLVGATTVGAAPGDGAREIEWKHASEFDPDTIIVLSEVVTLDEACAEAAVLASEHGWWGQRAVRQREVYVADGTAMQGPGPGVVAAMEAMARMCRPDLRAELGDGPGQVGVRKLEMAEGQRCRPSLLTAFFREMTW